MPEVDTLYQQNWRNFCEISNSFLFLSPYQQRTDVSSSSLVGTWSLMLSGITNVTCSSKASVFLMLLRGLVVESPLCGDQSPSALWHQLRCELPRWHGPGTQASATRWLDSGTGPHLRHGVITLITRSGAIIEPCQIQLAAHWRNKKLFLPSTRVMTVIKQNNLEKNTKIIYSLNQFDVRRTLVTSWNLRDTQQHS